MHWFPTAGHTLRLCPDCGKLCIRRKTIGTKARRIMGVLERDNYRCVFCGRGNALTIDHILPRARGGTHRLDNLRTLCAYCNNERGDFELF